MGTQTLHCTIGNHKWERKSKRGKLPRNCPDHQPPILVKPTMRVLRCGVGDHDWEAPRKKGKGPANCPEHRPTPTIDLDRMQAGRSNKAQADREATIREIISAPNAHNCRCGIDPSMNDLELRSLCTKSCTSPGGICSVLDRCMRRVYTYA